MCSILQHIILYNSCCMTRKYSYAVCEINTVPSARCRVIMTSACKVNISPARLACEFSDITKFYINCLWAQLLWITVHRMHTISICRSVVGIHFNDVGLGYMYINHQFVPWLIWKRDQNLTGKYEFVCRPYLMNCHNVCCGKCEKQSGTVKKIGACKILFSQAPFACENSGKCHTLHMCVVCET